MSKLARERIAWLAPALAVAAVLAVPSAASAAGPAACGPKDSLGGDWRSFGKDYSNSRFQDREKLISPGDAPTLRPAWTFSTVEGGGSGDVTGTPVVVDGCVYVATNRGWVFAMNADTGALVWKAKVPYGGVVSSSVGAGPDCATPDPTAGKKGKSKKKKSSRKKKSSKRSKRKSRKRKRPARRKPVSKACSTVYVAVSRAGGLTSDEGSEGEGCPPGDPCVGPYVVSFDRKTGKVAWATPSLDQQPGADAYGSPVIFERTVMVGISGGASELGDSEEGRYAFQGAIAFVDTETGKLVRKTWTIHPPGQPDDEYAGGTVWGTPAVDPQDKVAFFPTGNPFNPRAEHEHSNAIVKVDVNRKSKRFAQIVGAYKGDVDEYLPGLAEAPCFDFPGNGPVYYPQGLGSCADLDLDFGPHPNLFTDGNGRKLVGAGQKSGVYHVFDAKTMQPVWKQLVGPPSAVGGIVGSTATDGHSIYGPITAPGYIWSLSAPTGSYRWVGVVADGAHWADHASVANGVVYTVDLTGFLDAYDARTGVQLAKRPLMLGGTNTPASLSWSGVSVARNTVYAAVGMTGLSEGFVVAFKPGGVQDVPADAGETASNPRTGGGGDGGGGGDPGGGGGGDSGPGTAVVAGPGATYTTYATPVMTTTVGGQLSFVNLDLPQHDVVADEKGPDGRPLFRSRLAGVGEVVPVEGLDRVRSGQTYGFFCSIHPGMRGQLAVR
ncbi:MAG TPA: PQQ-binding-like beta-propeller repeat protein [Thermoleophilaceae bacterium]|jgi:outer membrane protein assembly factor BamB/plastocyanin